MRVLRHPLQHWGWLALFIGLMIALVVGGILASRRLESVPEEATLKRG